MGNSSVNNINDQNERYAHYKAFDNDKYYIFKVYDIIKKLNTKFNFHKVLDVGCADGSFSKKLKDDFGVDAYGLDISKNAVRLANTLGVKAKVHNLDTALPYPDNHFDLVVACEIIEHLYDTDFFVSELRRVLKKGGVLIISTPNLVSLVNRMKVLLGKYPNFVPEYNVGGAGHIRAYTIPVLRHQLESHKMKIIVQTSPNITFPMISKHIPYFFKKIAMRMGDIFPKMGSHMILVAKKF